MIIAHNMLASNTLNKLNKNTKNASTSLEKISSGLRIGKASDDAAGLAISEKMRAQVRGMDMAARNSQDGISLIQTAEGGMSEVNSLVQRMRELTVQGANDTLNGDDRSAIQKELDQLKGEINNISENTTFNNIKLLDGSISTKKSTLRTENITVNVDLTIPNNGSVISTNVQVDGKDIRFNFNKLGIDKVYGSAGFNSASIGSNTFNCVSNELAPTVEWEKSFGGSLAEGVNSVKQTSDGGFIFIGNTMSSDGDVASNHGYSDLWVVKTDATGNIQWEKTFGGSDVGVGEVGYSIEQTSDGGYIMIGTTGSNDGDLTGFASPSSSGWWTIKLDSSGNIEWQKLYDDIGQDLPLVIKKTSDGGFIGTGITFTDNGTFPGTWSDGDGLVIKYDSSGNIQWKKALGGSSIDILYSMDEASDGGFVLAGYSESNDGNAGASTHGLRDSWLVKLDSSGNIEWKKSYGGSSNDIISSIKKTSDNGYIVVGCTNSTDGDITSNHGSSDSWVMKLDDSGNVQWKKTLGGSNIDKGESVFVTSDGGYVILGESKSTDGDLSSNKGGSDAWIVKLDSSGNLTWQKSLGGSGDETVGYSERSIQQTSDGGFIFGITSNSTNGDVSGNHGGTDAWVVKLSPPAVAPSTPVEKNLTLSDLESDNKKIHFNDAKITFSDSNLTKITKIEVQAEIISNEEKGLILQVGPNTGQIMHVPIDSMKAVDLGLIDGIPDVTDYLSANASISYCDIAIKKVSEGRASLGAKHNALEHIISNLNNSSENLTAAESRIRDVDMAKEMMNYTKNNILSQAAQSILIQVNQGPQRVLELLQK